MSQFTDFILKASLCLTYKVDQYSKFLIQGADNCCLRKQIQILSTYIELLSENLQTGFLSISEMEAIVENSSKLCNCFLGNVDDYVASTVGSGSIVGTGSDSNNTNISIHSAIAYAWNLTIGTTPIDINFGQNFGNNPNGTGWGMSYEIYNSQMLRVDPIITNRTASGFTVAAEEDNVHFEGQATLIS